MTVFADTPRWPRHGTVWGHLVSDRSLEELHEFAARISLPRLSGKTFSSSSSKRQLGDALSESRKRSLKRATMSSSVLAVR